MAYRSVHVFNMIHEIKFESTWSPSWLGSDPLWALCL